QPDRASRTACRTATHPADPHLQQERQRANTPTRIDNELSISGLEEGEFGGGYIGFGSGQAQVLFAPPGVEPVLPDMGVDVDSRGAVDAAHAEAVRAGHEVIYGPVDEPWGVRRFFVRDPHGVVISVLAHE
ncbi:MAG: VOC family protein, partial [Solirubrobacteraceae bacterium]